MPRFVIQQHAATSMHWDFRLEVGGTFRSWSVRRVDGRRWLLVKRRDEYADTANPVATSPESVLSGRTIAGMQEGMPPRGVKKGTKRARQYEKIKKSAKDQGRSEERAEEIAARTVNKERARTGESRTRSRTSVQGKSRPKGRTRDQLYNEAKKLNVEGRSRMNKSQLQRAVDAKKR